MVLFLISLFIIAGLNLIPNITNFKSTEIEKNISLVLLSSLLLNLTIIVLFFNDIKIKGFYTNSIIGITFIITCLIFFTIVRNNWKKLLKVILLIPIIALTLFTLFFSQSIAKFKINQDYNIQIVNRGFLGCGESLKIFKTKYFIFEKVIQNKNNLCVQGIYDIKTTKFNEEQAEFLIFHNGKFESENPVKFKFRKQ